MNPTWEDIRTKIKLNTKITDDGCWEWIGPLSTSGYCRIWGTAGHRMSYQAYIGPIGVGLDIDHLCRNRACINPAHLEPVTRKENLARGCGIQLQKKKAMDKIHCSKGHKLTIENTYIRPSDGVRQCRKCKKAAWKKYQMEKKVFINARKRKWRSKWREKGIRK